MKCSCIFSILVGLLMINACTSTLQKVGEKHQTAAEKWNALAQYTSSDLPLLGFTIAANLEIINNSGFQEISLSKIRLRHDDDRYSIDLLNPQFEHKFLCKDGCVQLVEYNSKNGSMGNTLVAEYLNKYEFELFKFHADLFVLNDTLEELAQLDNQKLDDYLYYLSTMEPFFSSLASITRFLKNELTIDKYQTFLNDPKSQYSNLVYQMLQDSPTSSSINSLLRQTILQHGNNADSKWTSSDSDINMPDENWDKDELDNDPTQLWDLTAFNEMPWANLPPQIMQVSIWSEARDMPIAVGDTVCTFQDNLFGLVKSMDEPGQLKVFVQGQAKQEKDGIISNLAAGTLFIEDNKVEFLPMLEDRTLSAADVALCGIQ